MIKLGFRLLFAGMAAALLSGSAAAECRCSARISESTPADDLKARLRCVTADSLIIFGHHDDTAYGVDWTYIHGRSDVRDVTGQFPALMSWDLGDIELDSVRNLDGVPFDFIRQQVLEQHRRGGLSTFSWHPRNPITLGDSWSVTADDVPALIADSTSDIHAKAASWIGNAADFFDSLRDDDGNRIPVIFRPWHEHTGSWFWWGVGNTTPDSYIALWHLTRSIFDAKNLDNIVWAYSPDKIKTDEEYMTGYPGDEYIDIMGADVYHFNAQTGVPQYFDFVRADLGAASREAAKRGKIVALTETGCEGLTVPDWYNECLLKAITDFPIAYVCVWRNANRDTNAFKNSANGHFYVPYPGHPQTDSFKNFYNNPRTLFVDDLSKICR